MLPKKTRIQSLFCTYSHCLLGLGFVFLVAQFYLTERLVDPAHWISCFIDYKIPFVPAFVIPYLLWFPFIAFGLTLLAFSDRADFVKTICMLFAGFEIALIIYLIFPHGQPLRPAVLGDDFFSQVIATMVYKGDTPTNCCPSIHVLNQMAVHLGLCQSKLLKNKPIFKWISLVFTIFVCASTCLIKQHSIIDVVLALFISALLYGLFFKTNWLKLFQREKSPAKSKQLQS